jgi:hypothetical protein
VLSIGSAAERTFTVVFSIAFEVALEKLKILDNKESELKLLWMKSNIKSDLFHDH